jgi:Uma2 family endonuclease
MATKILMTLEQFYAMPESDRGETYELDRGELITMSPSPSEHEMVKNQLAALLILFLYGKGLA